MTLFFLDAAVHQVMVVGATNRYEVLDDALTRPGRLDRIVRVELPDRTGREAILNVHARKVSGPTSTEEKGGHERALREGEGGRWGNKHRREEKAVTNE